MKLILALFLILGGVKMETQNLCLFELPDGTIVCAGCDNPPPASTFLRPAPEGTPEGIVDNPKIIKKPGPGE
jgi:hypothetical protein